MKGSLNRAVSEDQAPMAMICFPSDQTHAAAPECRLVEAVDLASFQWYSTAARPSEPLLRQAALDHNARRTCHTLETDNSGFRTVHSQQFQHMSRRPRQPTGCNRCSVVDLRKLSPSAGQPLQIALLPDPPQMAVVLAHLVGSKVRIRIALCRPLAKNRQTTLLLLAQESRKLRRQPEPPRTMSSCRQASRSCFRLWTRSRPVAEAKRPQIRSCLEAQQTSMDLEAQKQPANNLVALGVPSCFECRNFVSHIQR